MYTTSPTFKKIAIISLAIFSICTFAFYVAPSFTTLDPTTTEAEADLPAIDSSRDHEGDTFSVVAYDPNTGEIGGAGTSCYNGNINFLNDIIRDGSGTLLGAIHTQAAYTSGNQNNARTRMLAGDTPAQIISYLDANDCCSSNANSRQYGIVGISSGGTITTAGYTGSSNGNWAGNITGIDPNTGMHYAIQGNILDTSTGGGGQQDILDDMEAAFQAATGTLADKLMAALQGAKRVGGDNRCINSGNSGLASFVRVLRPSDNINTPYIDLWEHPNISAVEPIDVLQCSYDTAVSTPHCRTTINTFPYAMDFETKSWEQETASCSVNSSWIRSRFATPSGSTGPSGPNQGALYAFVEASNVGGQGTAPRSAIIGSPCFDIPSNHTAELTFDHHMYGANMGTLALTASDNGGSSWSTLWSLSGDQGNTWNNDVVVDISAYSGSTVKFRFDATTGNGYASDFALDDINITITPLGCAGSAKIWNGSNWSGGSAPNATNTVTIDGNYDTSIHGDIVGCTLTVNSGRTLTVKGGDFVEINGNIINDGTLIVEHEGSVVQTDATPLVINNGTINVLQSTPTLASRDFMILGSPMTGETRGSVWSSAFLVLDANTGNFVPHPDVEAQFPGAENFADDNNDFWSVYGAGGTIDVGEGYLVRPQAGYGQPGGVFNFTYDDGTLNTGDVNFPVTYNTPGPTSGDNKNASPNVLANPYPSAIFADDFINANSMVDEVYFWEHLTPPSTGLPGAGSMNFSMEDISMYNLSGGVGAGNPEVIATRPNGYISTGQGFGIKATAAGTATFTNAMRRTTNNNTLRGQNDKDRVWISVENSQYEMGGATLLAFNENATSRIDSGYDSRRLATVVSLYTHLEDGSEQLGIQTREAFGTGVKVPVGFSTQLDATLDYKISIATIEGENLDGATVYLIDNYTNTVTNLSQEAYAFSSEKGTFHNRFMLQFEGDIVLGTNENTLESISMFPNPTRDVLNVYSPTSRISKITVHDVQGRVVNESAHSNVNSVQLDLSVLKSAIYFVTITTEEGTLTKRVVRH